MSSPGSGTANQGNLHLEATVGRATGSTFVIEDRLVIGRSSDEQGRLADDPELSRDHAEIARAESGEFTITDLSSTNGTFVNGDRLAATAAVLKDGDEIEVGGTTLVVRSAPALAPPPPSVDVRATTVSVRAPTFEPPPSPQQADTGEHEPQPSEQDAVEGGAAQLVEVRLTVDFEERTAQLSVYGAGEPIRLELEDGRWGVRGRSP